MPVEWVQQQHGKGCGPAVLSMLTGMPYEKVCACWPKIDFNLEGIGKHQVDAFLAIHGFAVQRFYACGWNGEEQHDWPFPPWADAHLCHLIVAEGAPYNHWVVMLGDGTVFDPMVDPKQERRTLAHYYSVNNIAAVIKV